LVLAGPSGGASCRVLSSLAILAGDARGNEGQASGRIGELRSNANAQAVGGVSHKSRLSDGRKLNGRMPPILYPCRFEDAQ
jgi:hypothetical protein